MATHSSVFAWEILLYSFDIYCMNISHYTFFIHSFYWYFWNIIALQCCVSFCHITAWITYMYAYIPSLLSFHPPPHPTLGHRRALSWAPSAHSSFLLTVYVTHGGVYMSAPLSPSVPPSPSPVVSTVCSLCLHLYFCPTNRFICNIFLDSM